MYRTTLCFAVLCVSMLAACAAGSDSGQVTHGQAPYDDSDAGVATDPVPPPAPAKVVAHVGAEPVRHLRIWSQPHPLLDPVLVTLGGSREWWPDGADFVGSEAVDADIRVHIVTPDNASKDEMDWANCVRNDKGGYVLAVANLGGEIHFFAKCLEAKDADGKTIVDHDGNPLYNTWLAKIVMAHEVGHELGLPHVPYECDGTELISTDGRHLCGAALMNPNISGWTPSPTETDDLNYEVYASNRTFEPTVKVCAVVYQP